MLRYRGMNLSAIYTFFILISTYNVQGDLFLSIGTQIYPREKYEVLLILMVDHQISPKGPAIALFASAWRTCLESTFSKKFT